MVSFSVIYNVGNLGLVEQVRVCVEALNPDDAIDAGKPVALAALAVGCRFSPPAYGLPRRMPDNVTLKLSSCVVEP